MEQLTGAARIRGDREGAGGPFPYQIAPPSAVRRRRAILFTLTGIAAYILTLAATLPARLLLERSGDPGIWLAVSGTVWNGEAALAQGHAVRWRWSPLASLANLAFTTEVDVIGADTELRGIASWRPSGIELEDLRGNASGTLLSAITPELPFVCDFPMRVELDRLAFGGSHPGAAGEIRTAAGSCTPRNASVALSAPVPPLIAEATINVGGSNGWVAARSNRSDKLVSFTVMPNGGTSIDVLPSGAALFPGAQSARFAAE